MSVPLNTERKSKYLTNEIPYDSGWEFILHDKFFFSVFELQYKLVQHKEQRILVTLLLQESISFYILIGLSAVFTRDKMRFQTLQNNAVLSCKVKCVCLWTEQCLSQTIYFVERTWFDGSWLLCFCFVERLTEVETQCTYFTAYSVD